MTARFLLSLENGIRLGYRRSSPWTFALTKWELRQVNLAAYIDLQNATNTTIPR